MQEAPDRIQAAKEPYEGNQLAQGPPITNPQTAAAEARLPDGNDQAQGPPIGNPQPAAAEARLPDGNDPADGVRPTVWHHKRTGVVLNRKRQRDPTSWKQNVRKRLRQSGQRYVDSRGHVQGAKSVKTKKDCTECKFKCSLNFSERDRPDIFNDFWSSTDNEKQFFLVEPLLRNLPKNTTSQVAELGVSPTSPA